VRVASPSHEGFPAMFLFTAILFVLLTHLQFVGLLMIGGSLIAAVALFLTRPGAERTTSPALGPTSRADDEQHTDHDHEYPQAA
jgi:hypothetical protein